MKKNRQKRPSFLYAVIIFLALVILALGALTLYSLQDLIDLRSKVSGSKPPYRNFLMPLLTL